MKRLTLAAFLAALAPAALAQPYVPCPSVSAGWSYQFPPPLTSVQYDQSTLTLYVVFNYTTASAFANVPFTVMQGFGQTASPVTLYTTLVVPYYHALLLQEGNNCPLLFENGAQIWSD
jgi:KTSC domain